ncbi:MAG: tetratricopeptide repeat protein [Pseudomonadota bacterium]
MRFNKSMQETARWLVGLILGATLIAGAAHGADEEPDPGALIASGAYGEAIDALTQRIDSEAQPNPATALLLGRALLSTGEFESALTVLQRGQSQADPDQLTLKVEIASILGTYHNRSTGDELFREVLERYRQNPDRFDARNTIAAGQAAQWLAERESALYREALDIFERAAGKNNEAPDAHTAIGDLLLDRYNNAEAQGAFRDALARDPTNLPATFGLARSLHFDHAPAFEAQIAKALDLNPNYVPALAFLARAQMDTEQYEEADKTIERALRVNPKSPETLSLRAGLQYLQDDRDGFTATYQHLRSLAPGYLTLFETVAEIAAQNRRYRDASRFAASGVRIDPRYWRGHALLGINQLRLGEMDAGRKSLDTAFAGDPYDIWTKNTLDLLDRTDTYESERSQRFELVGPRKETRILAPMLLPIAEEAYQYYAARYRYFPPTPIRIEVYPRHSDFSVRIVGLSGVDVLGVSFGPVIVLESPATGHFGEFNWASALWHEIAHTFHLGMTGGRLPRWFAEGLAVHEEWLGRAGWGADVSPSFLSALRENKLLPPSQLNQSFLRPSYPEQVNHAYFQGALLVEFIEQNHGFEAIESLLEGYRQGRDTGSLFTSVLGVSPEALDQKFTEFMTSRYGEMAQKIFGDGNDDGPYRQLVKSAVEAITAGKSRDAIERLQEAQALFPEHAGPGTTYRRLAETYQQLSEPLRAIAQLSRNIDINADDFSAHLELADLLKETAGPSAAAPILNRALLIQPFDAEVHERLAELNEASSDWSAAAANYRAIGELNPTDPLSVGYRLARALNQAGEQEDARREILAVLEDAPLYAEALELLLKIRDDANQPSQN